MEQKQKRLTDKQVRFCEEYIVDNNATAAAIRAGYSENTARVQASQLRAHPAVNARIRELQADTSERTRVTTDYVVEGLCGLAEDLDAPHSSRVQAYAHLGRHLGMFSDKMEVTGDVQVGAIERVIIDTNKKED